MKYITIVAILASIAAAAPSAMPAAEPVDNADSAFEIPTADPNVVLETSEASHLEKRVVDPVSLAIIGGVTSGVVGVAAKEALDIVKAAANWNSAREAFTKETVKNMWNRRRNDREAAVCYNMAYDVSKPGQTREKSSVKLKSGPLNTDYDCFFMTGPQNHFWSRGDGGFINLAIMHNNQFCTFDRKTSDLYCK